MYGVAGGSPTAAEALIVSGIIASYLGTAVDT
jgi:hypothetical protein